MRETKILKFFTKKVLFRAKEGDYMSAYKAYVNCLLEHKEQIPLNIVELATSDWYFNAADKRCFKDSWVVAVELTNNYKPQRKGREKAKLSLTLLGAYHDLYIKLDYLGVKNVKIDSYFRNLSKNREYDSWRIDEFSVNKDGDICSGQVQPDTFLKEFSYSISD